MKYYHYGTNYIRKDKTYQNNKTSEEYSRDFINKPEGLWSSQEDSEFSWEEFCTGEDFNIESLEQGVTFEISPDAKLLYINDDSDLAKLQKYLVPFTLFEWERKFVFDWKKIAEDYDGIVMYFTRLPYDVCDLYCLNAWDVDSACIWNLNVLKNIEPIGVKAK